MNYTEREFKATSFLRYLYGELLSGFKSLPVSEKAKEFGIGDYLVFCAILIDLKVLDIQNGRPPKYKWNSDFDPNPELGRKILVACKAYHDKSKPEKFKKFKFPTKLKMITIEKPSSLGKSMQTVLNEQTTNIMVPEIEKKSEPKKKIDNSHLLSYLEELREAGLHGTINIQITI